MEPSQRARPPAMRTLAVAAVALAGLALAFTPWVERLDHALLDAQWATLAKFDRRSAPPDIVIVGIDEASARAIDAPPGLWHEALGMALTRIASARPRAIALELALPERSFDAVRPGVDRALMVGLAAARDNGPLVAALAIDARTRSARPIHAPFLAVLGEERLGLGLLASDSDGVTRRYTLAVPTEDGAFPTLAGRLCRALASPCSEGLVHFALGAPYRYIPLGQVLEMRDTDWLAQRFRDRIVLLGEIQRFAHRIAVPTSLAAWEDSTSEAPAVVVHAQSLRTALAQAAPREASRPVVALTVLLAAWLVLMRDPRLAAVGALLAAGGAFAAAVLALRAGLYVPIAAALLTLAIAWLGRAGWTASRAFEVRRRS